MLFELTTGRRLFKGQSEYETLKLICDKEYPLPSQVRPGYPLPLEQIVMRALAKRREDRYQSAREMQQDLESYVREERIPVSTVSLTRWMQSLFAEKLAQQKEALQDIKQLADVIAAQQTTSMYEGTNTSTTHPTAPNAVASIPVPPPARRFGALGMSVALLGVCGLGVGGFFAAKEAGVLGAAPAPTSTASAVPAASAPAEAKGSIDVDTKPDGCAIWINGDLRSETTPAKIDKLPLGRAIDVKVTKDGLEPYKESITLTDAAPTKKVVAEMKAGSVTVLLKVDPPASVWLDGKPWKGDRAKVDGISAGEEHKLVLSVSGYAPKTITFTAKQGETKSYTETLVRADAATAAREEREHEKKAKSDDKPAAAASGPAKVRVGSKGGFCNVSINGTSYGSTPVEATVTSGNVRVSCKPASGPSMSQSVSVQAGETARVSFKVEP
jgi:serine/threonine-protein kinase